MKKKMKLFPSFTFLWPALLFTLLFSLKDQKVQAQTAGTAIQMKLMNFVQTTTNRFEFEVYLTNTGTTNIALRGYSFGLNNTAGLLNGGTGTLTYLSRSPLLAALPLPTTNYATANHMRLTTTTGAAGTEVTLVANTPVLIAKVRVQTSSSWIANFNPFLPISPITAMQLTNVAGRTQCTAVCYVNGGGFTLVGTANSPSSTVLNVLTGVMEPSPTGPTPFLLNAACNNLTLTLDQAISCHAANDGSIQASTTAPGSWLYGLDGGPMNDPTGLFSGISTGIHTVCATEGSNICCKTILVTQPSPISLTFNPTVNPSCSGNDGTISISISGGTAILMPYTTVWKDANLTVLNVDPNATSMSNLPRGDYSVEVTDDNFCSAIFNYSFGLTSVTASSTPILCAGGNSTVSAVSTASTTPVTYAIGSTPLPAGFPAGTYIVTATDATACTLTTTITVTESVTPIVLSMSGTNVNCFGNSTGTAVVSASGGTPDYTYEWSPGGDTTNSINGLSAGTYTVVVTDANGCTKSTTITITQPSAALTATTNTSNVNCFGGTNGIATVTAIGGTPMYSYLWSPTGGTSATTFGIGAGNYSVIITDANGCSTVASAIINQPTSALNAILSATNVTTAGGSDGSATVVASGGTPAYTYSWSPSGGNAATATGLSAGTYVVTITDANGCTLTDSIEVIESLVPLEASISGSNIDCFGQSTGSATVTASGGNPGYTYSWSPGGATTSSITNLSAGNYIVIVTDANSMTVSTSIVITQPASALSATAISSNVSCFGGSNGSASVTASGGTPGYSYLWSPSGGTSATASGLSAGNYMVLVTDTKGCTTTASVSVSAPILTLNAVGTGTNVACFNGNNGIASVIVTGGTPNYSYLWSPSGGTGSSANGLVAGTYIVLVTDANGCSTATSIIITQPSSALTATATSTNVNCFGGSTGNATVAASGGTPGYSYLWSPSGGTSATASALSAGTYAVLVTDANGCTTATSVTIHQPSAPLNAVTMTVNDVSCFAGSNGSATVLASGGTPSYLYAWSPSGGTGSTANGLVAGTYIVQVTDANGCATSSSIIITEPTAALMATVTGTNVNCFGEATGMATVNASGGTPDYTYSWSPTGDTTAVGNNLSAGTYIITVTDANGCTTSTSIIITEPSAPLSVSHTSTDVNCFGGADGTATVTAAGGTPGYTYLWSPSGGNAASASGLSAGMYQVLVTDANGCTAIVMITISEPSSALAIVTTGTDVSCFGGSNGTASVLTIGGTPSYQYAWSPTGGNSSTANGLIAGTYMIVVTDANGCTSSDSVIISEPAAPLSASATGTNISCFGGNDGTAMANASGGTPNYTYSWSPSGGTAANATGLTAGIYIVTVTDANGCATTASVTLTEPPLSTITCPANITLNTLPGLCNNTATYSASATGTPTPVITYSLSGATGGSGTGTGSGLVFNKGITIVNLVATNSCGSVDCSFTIEVIDNQAPTLVCPLDQTMNVILHTCAATYEIMDPISDNCPNATWEYTLGGATTGSASLIPDGTSSGLVSFNKGITTVTLSGTDGTNNAITCSFTVTVIDNENPVAICHPALVTLNAQGEAVLLASQVDNGSTDNCAIVSRTLSKENFTCNDLVTNNALNFNISLDRVMSNATAMIPVGNSARTICAWIKPATLQTALNIISQGTGTQMFGLGLDNNLLSFYGPPFNYTSTLSVPLNTWTFVALTHDGSNTLQLYMNTNVETFSGMFATSVSKLIIGCTSFDDGATTSSHYNGGLDEVQIFDRVLTSTELANVRIGGNPASINRMLYYPFNEGTGNLVSDASGTNHATLLNPTGYNWVAGPAEKQTFQNVTLTVTDAAGNSSQCTTEVGVVDGFPGVYLNAKVMLAGPYNIGTGLMNDNLRASIPTLIPLTEPYSSPPFNKLVSSNEPGGETVTPAILSVSNADAIVDWVFLELRSATSPSFVLYTKRALVQRDGDIVSNLDGVSPVRFANVPNGSYIIGIKHRNHLGVMSDLPVILGNCRGNATSSFNFITDPVRVTKPYVMWPWAGGAPPLSSTKPLGYYPYYPRKAIGAINALWSGDADNNKNVSYNGIVNDRLQINTAVGLTTSANTLYDVYRTEDVNMDGMVRYLNTNNDKDIISINILTISGYGTINNIITQQTPN